MVPNDGTVSESSLEPGSAISLHLPPDALRVLKSSGPAEPEAEVAEAEAAEATASSDGP
jgi:hypothetical protein